MCTENKITEVAEAEVTEVAEAVDTAEAEVTEAVETAEAEVAEVAEAADVPEVTETEDAAETTVIVEDEEDEPMIIRFPDEEEDEPVVDSMPDDEAPVIEEEEKYVPKAVAFAGTALFMDQNREKEEKKKDPYLEKAQKVRSFTAGMIHKSLFNVGTFLCIGFISASLAYIAMYDLIYKFCKNILGIQFDGLIVGSYGYSARTLGIAGLAVIAIVIQLIMAVLMFIGFRIAAGSAGRNGENMSTAGLSMARIALIFMIISAIMVTLGDMSVMSLVASAISILHLIFGIKSISRLRNTIVCAETKKMSVTFALLCFVQIPAYIIGFKDFFTEDMFNSTDEKGYFVVLCIGMILAAISLLMMGIFVFVYNAKLNKFKKTLDAE